MANKAHQFLTDTPNFSVILPGPCNASCEFCFWKEDKEAGNKFLVEFDRASQSLPAMFTQLSITGGEPTLSPIFSDFLDLVKEHSSRWRKVVLTTNGAVSAKMFPDVGYKIIDFVNISRHAVADEDNFKIFKTHSVPCTDALKDKIGIFNMHGTPVTLNVVINSKEEINLKEWINYAKLVGANRIAFRIDIAEGLEAICSTHEILKNSGWMLVDTSSCPVCKSETFLMEGMYISFKYGVAEPSSISKYELVMQPNGKITYDWAGTIKFHGEVFKPATVRGEDNNIVHSTSSCGGYSRRC